MESLELCTHWVMEDSVTIHIQPRLSIVLRISIWGLGFYWALQNDFHKDPPIFRGFQRSGVYEVEGGCLE